LNDARVAVVGLGHALLGDDALGLAVVRALDSHYRVPASVAVIDAGTPGLDLAGHLLDCERLIFVDALVGSEPPGTVRTVRHDELLAARPAGPRFSPHEPSIHDALSLLSLAGHGPREAVLVGVVPGSLEVGVELSQTVSEALPRALDEVVGHLQRFGIELERRHVSEPEGLRIELEGIVQGVGFRPWLHRTARRLGLRGSVRNTGQGVTLEVFGEVSARTELLQALAQDLPPLARIDALRVESLVGRGPSDFTIAESEAASHAIPSLPADVALCDACRREIDDPTDRRFGYAFTHCTDCGPRHSIVTGLPYDRAQTSMHAFEPCAECAREYADPNNRRFHAQAIACARCGPRLWLEAPLGARLEVSDVVSELVRRLDAGEVIALQGLGGFHLACDATNADAIHRLRVRKQRDEKPFAVMVANEASAEALAELDAAARAALSSPEHPIVIARIRSSTVAPAVAPGSRRIGVFLPYTPLHHLLLGKFGRPLVLTSGNRSGEPIAVTRDDAQRTLGGVADAFLFHDRPIVRRVEDSVVLAGEGRIQVLRRARGYAPRAVRLPFSVQEPVLAVGGHLKNTVCLVVGERAHLSSHLGDLESHEAERAFRADVEDFERLLGVRPRVVAHDLHPDYASTRYAVSRQGSSLLGVQHHHAHVLAALAEHRIEGPVLAAVFDGSGFGTDGTAWGSEILAVEDLACRRLFSARPLALAGGEVGIREVWRVAWALVRDAFGPEEAERVAGVLGLFQHVAPEVRARVSRMLDERVNIARVRGLGRYFDAFGALCLGRPRAAFEGQIAMVLEEVASTDPAAPYPIGLPRSAASGEELTEDNELDFRPTVRAFVSDLLGGVGSATLCARFHATVVEATTELLELAGSARQPVVLSGGCFQNQILSEGLRRRLAARSVVGRGQVPVNDGGIALGQAYAAALALRAGEI